MDFGKKSCNIDYISQLALLTKKGTVCRICGIHKRASITSAHFWTFLNPPTQSNADVIYGWSLTEHIWRTHLDLTGRFKITLLRTMDLHLFRNCSFGRFFFKNVVQMSNDGENILVTFCTIFQNTHVFTI